MARRMISKSQLTAGVKDATATLINQIGRSIVSICRSERVEDENNQYLKTAKEVSDLLNSKRLFYIKTEAKQGVPVFAICAYTAKTPSTLDKTTVFTGKIIFGVKLSPNYATGIPDIVDLTGGTWTIKYLYTGVDSWYVTTEAAAE